MRGEVRWRTEAVGDQRTHYRLIPKNSEPVTKFINASKGFQTVELVYPTSGLSFPLGSGIGTLLDTPEFKELTSDCQGIESFLESLSLTIEASVYYYNVAVDPNGNGCAVTCYQLFKLGGSTVKTSMFLTDVRGGSCTTANGTTG